MLTVPDEVKELLKSDSVRKNFRISFPNGERADIINDNLIQESVSFTESVCSQNTLKYGLSEASTLSFQTVGVENIKGYVIDAEIEIDATEIADTVGNIQESDDVDYPYYPIPYGRFIVDSCKRSGEMEQRQVECYSYIAGFSSLFNSVMAGYWPTDSYEIQYPGTFLMSYLYPHGIPDDYISTSTDIESSLIQIDRHRMHFQNFGSFYLTDVNHYCTMYNVPDYFSIPLNNKELLEITVSKVDNYDEILEDAVEGIVDIIESSGIEMPYYRNKTLKQRYPDLESAIKAAIIRMAGATIQPYATVGNKFCYPDSVQIPEGDNTLYFQNLSFTYSSSTATFQTIYRLTIPTEPMQVEVEFASSHYTGGTYTLSGNLYQITSVKKIKLSDTIISTYDSASLAVSSSSSQSFILSDESTYMPFYIFEDVSSFESVANAMCEAEASFGRNGRDAHKEIKALDNTLCETITADMYSSLWYDDAEIQSLKSVLFSYTNTNSESKTILYGEGYYYDLTSNEVISSYTDADTIYDLLDDYFFPNAIYSEYVPYNLTCVGLPYLEAGDYITVQDKEGNEFNSYILRQTISGIQHLTSSMEAQSVDV